MLTAGHTEAADIRRLRGEKIMCHGSSRQTKAFRSAGHVPYDPWQGGTGWHAWMQHVRRWETVQNLLDLLPAPFTIFCRLHSRRAASAVHRNVALLKLNDLAYTAVRNVLQQGAPPMHASHRIHSPFDHQDLQCRYGQRLPGRPHHAAARCLYCVLVIMQLSALPHIPRPMLNSKSCRSIKTGAVYSSTRTESCFIPSLLLHDMSTAQCLLRRSGCIYSSLSSSRVRVPETLCHARGFG